MEVSINFLSEYIVNLTSDNSVHIDHIPVDVNFNLWRERVNSPDVVYTYTTEYQGFRIKAYYTLYSIRVNESSQKDGPLSYSLVFKHIKNVLIDLNREPKIFRKKHLIL